MGMPPWRPDIGLLALFVMYVHFEVTRRAKKVVTRLVEGALDMGVAYATRARATEAGGLAFEAPDTDEILDDFTKEVANTAFSAVLVSMRVCGLFLRKYVCKSFEATITILKDDKSSLHSVQGCTSYPIYRRNCI